MHDLNHEDLCVRLSAGELGADEAADARDCPECRRLLETLRLASGWAAQAAAAVPPGLNERIARQGGRRPAPMLKWGALALAALAVTLYVPRLRQDKVSDLHWSNDLERDMTRAESSLARLSQSIGVEAEALEIDEALKDLDRSVKNLGRQIGKNAKP